MKEAKGCGMRCAVGFLSHRSIREAPLLKEEFQRRRLAGCTSLYKKDMMGHFGCVNAIEFSNNGGEWLVSGGDDRRVLLWHMEKAIHSQAKPVKLKGEHLSNIFCLAFDSTNKRIFSAGNDEQVILHDVERGETLNVFLHEDAVYGLSVSPINDNVFASSSDDGRVLIWDTREPPHGEPFCLANYPSAFHSVMFNPVEPRLLATANSKEGVGLWDIRKPRSSLLRYGGNLSLQSAMSVRFNSTGTQLLALRRRLPPVLYELHSRLPIFQFDNQGYFNSCTMKSCCFAGDHDQYILSGSDDFNLYMWKIPKDPEAGGPGRVVNGAFMVLKGHRSIVNQVRFNPYTYMICSSGVEKVIKVWSPYHQPGSTGDLEGRVEDESRSLYTHEEYISLVLNSGSGLSHDYVSQSIQEDPRMMAFFDSLVRREIEGWSSDSDSDLSEGTILQLHARGRSGTRGGSDASIVSAFGSRRPSDSEHSSSSVASPPPESASSPCLTRSSITPLLQQTRQRRRPSYRDISVLDLINDSSDSSGYWPDPIPRPRSPSPRDNVSSSTSSPTSSSSSEEEEAEEEEEEQRRSTMRQRNAARRRLVKFRYREERPESAASGSTRTHYLGLDSCGYPDIKVEDPSSSSSGEDGLGRVPETRSSRDNDHVQFEPDTPPGTSATPSPDLLSNGGQGDKDTGMQSQEEERDFSTEPSSGQNGPSPSTPPPCHFKDPDDELTVNGNGTPGSLQFSEGGSADLHKLDSDSWGQSCSCPPLGSDCGSPIKHCSGANGRHRPDQECSFLKTQPLCNDVDNASQTDSSADHCDVSPEPSQASVGVSSSSARLKRTRGWPDDTDSESPRSEKIFKT
ncbi:DDB1- and CUL4-associated factor 5 [Polypterus senegalus]|nr:DDB1- and CUL4-associated factor 5 [Polypterus senegalus]